MNRFVLKALTGSLIFGALLYAIVYFFGTRSESLKFAEQSLMSAPAIESLVGHVKTVRLSPVGGYKSSFVNGDRVTTMYVNVSGDKKAVVAFVKVHRLDGVWQVDEVVIDGKQVSLEK